MKARGSARAHVMDVLYRETAPVQAESRVPQQSAEPIDLSKVESDEPLMTAAGVPASFFPPIEYDEDGRPRPARLYDVNHRDEPAEPAANAEDVSDARNDDTYRPLG